MASRLVLPWALWSEAAATPGAAGGVEVGQRVEAREAAQVGGGQEVAGGVVLHVVEARAAGGQAVEGVAQCVDVLVRGADAEGGAHRAGDVGVLAAAQLVAHLGGLPRGDAEQVRDVRMGAEAAVADADG